MLRNTNVSLEDREHQNDVDDRENGQKAYTCGFIDVFAAVE
jgi:hypothetical protein